MTRKALLLVMPLFLLFAGAAQAEERSYIVVYKENVSLRKEISQIRREDNVVPRVFGEVLQGAQVILHPSEARELAEDPAVRYIERDGLARTQRETSLWGLDRIDQRSLPLDGRTVPSGGAGVDVYVLDTGIRSDHEEFRGRVLPGWNAIDDGRGTEDCDGHGTHVSGTVAGSSYGVAPQAQIVPVRVLDCEGSGSWSGVIDGLDWIASQAEGLSVANMSLGGPALASVNEAVERLVDKGVPVAVAAGNENRNACLSSPASAPGATTVGATNVSDQRSSFSNWGPCVDLFAPGSGILSALHSSSSASGTLSGTSMASPHVAGVLALLLASGRGERDLLDLASRDLLLLPEDTPNRLLYLGDSAPLPPPEPLLNDNFASSLELGLEARAENRRATREEGEPRHVHALSGSSKSLWYHWTAPADGIVALSTGGSSFDTLLAVYSGSGYGDLDPVAVNDDAALDFTSRVSFFAREGSSYKIAVDGYGGASGSVLLRLQHTRTEVEISSGPARVTRNSQAEFVFRGSECSLDQAEWRPCASPWRSGDLPEGEHVFRVRSGPLEDSYTWTIDITPPPAPVLQTDGDMVFWEEEGRSFCSWGADAVECSSPEEVRGGISVWQEDEAGNRSPAAFLEPALEAPEIISGPSRKTVSQTAVFYFQGEGNFWCQLEGDWHSCQSPMVYENLAPGRYSFMVRSEKGPVSEYSWSVRKLQAPRIVRKPPRISAPNVLFRMRGSGTIWCALDQEEWKQCSWRKRYRGLSSGSHRFLVRVSLEGQTSDTREYSWRVR